MYAVGIDVSKGRSTVAVLEPLGKIVAKPFEVRHTKSGMNNLVNYLNTLDGECRIVLEHTGRYYEPVVRWLSGAGLFVNQGLRQQLPAPCQNRQGRCQEDWPLHP